MTVYIANDHGGYALKKQIMVHLQKRGIWVVNEGSDSTEIVRYPYYAGKVAAAISAKKADFGILICNSGVGMSITANKYKGVRAALARNEEGAMLCRQHNNANILCLPGKHLTALLACKMVDTFLDTDFLGERHSISLGLIKEAEEVNFSGGVWDVFDREKAANPPRKASEIPNILLDTDMLTDCDDTAALAMLLQLERLEKCRILGVTVSSRHPDSTVTCDVVNTYYGRGDLPLGAPKNGRGAFRDDSCFISVLPQEFPHTLKSGEDAPDAALLMREILAKAEPRSVKIVTIGYMTNLAALLMSPPDEISPKSGVELVRERVSEWVCMGGNFPDDPAIDNVNFTRDAENALYCLEHYPGKITFVGREIGHNIYVGESFHNMPQSNPVRRSYELHRGRYGDNWDHHTADPGTVLYAVFGCDKFFEFCEGEMTWKDDCSFTWNPEKPSNMRYVLQKIDRDEMSDIMDKIITEGIFE